MVVAGSALYLVNFHTAVNIVILLLLLFTVFYCYKSLTFLSCKYYTYFVIFRVVMPVMW